MAPQGFPERDIALHAAVLSFPHPVRRTRRMRVDSGDSSSSSSSSGKEEEEEEGGGEVPEVVVCVAPLPPHWEARYGEQVTREVGKLCAELKRKYHTSGEVII